MRGSQASEQEITKELLYFFHSEWTMECRMDSKAFTSFFFFNTRVLINWKSVLNISVLLPAKQDCCLNNMKSI